MSALEVQSLLQRLTALREGTGLEVQDLYTVLEKVHAKVLLAEPLVDGRSSAAYSRFTAELRRVTNLLDDALDKVSPRPSFILSSHVPKLLGYPARNGRSVHSSSRQRRPRGPRTSTRSSITAQLLAYLSLQRLAYLSLALVPRSNIAKQIEESQKDLQILLRLFSTYVIDLLPKQDSDNSVARPEGNSSRSQEPHLNLSDLPLPGRKQDMDKVSNFLKDNKTQVVAIIGMAGVGKTALTRALFRTEGFRYCLWVDRCQYFDPERIFREVMTKLRKELQDGEDPESVWWSMKEGLVNEKYLLVLDDIWNVDPRKWNQLLHLLCGKKMHGSKIVVTTRIPAAAASIQSVTKHNLQPLSNEDSVKLLRPPSVNGSQRENHKASSYHKLIIREVAERCSGLPKLINLMNNVLTEEIYENGARYAIEEFDRRYKDEGLLDVAKASYDHLPFHLQRCFLYCSLFPLDHIFDAEEMISLWVAEGLTQVSSREAQVDADSSKLLDECFDIFYESGSRRQMRYKMQYILHNFARYKGKDLYRDILIDECRTLIEQSIRYMSLMVDHTTKELPVSLIEQKDLRTLILLRRQDMVLCRQRSEIREIPSDYCQYLTALRVLDLHATRIHMLPDDKFGMLSNMRYLNLSQTDITELPKSFDKLQSLIYLNISQTRIAVVPELICKIRSLRYLNLSQTCVKELPATIGYLRSLQKLQLSHCRKLMKLPHHIVRLTNLQNLDLEGCHYLSEIPQDISSMKSLKELNILDCSSLCQMPNGLNTLSKIEVLPRYIAGNEGTILELQELKTFKTLGLHNLECVSALDIQEKWLEGNNKLESLTLHWNLIFKNSSDMVQHNDDSQPIEENSSDMMQHNDDSQPIQENSSDMMQHNDDSQPIQENSSDMMQHNDVSQPIQENSISDVEKLLKRLQPNKELKILEIVSYGGKTFPDWMTNSLPHLVEIRLVNVKCKRFPPLGRLPLLVTAEISGMDDITHVTNELNGNKDRKFPSLKKLTFSQMLNLESWPADGAICDSLEELSIIQCPNFQKLSKILPIKKLSVSITSRKLLSEGGLVGAVRSLKSLSISLCEELSSPSDIEGLSVLLSLEELEISGCDELESLPSGMGRLASLNKLSLIGCTKLCDVSELGKCTGLISLHICGCPMLANVPEDLRKITTGECKNCGMMH